MKELMEKYRPVRQRTVLGETSKDKAGALPPAVYTQQHNFNKRTRMAGPANDPNTEDRAAFTLLKSNGSCLGSLKGASVLHLLGAK